MNDNETNAPFKLPVRYERNGIFDATGLLIANLATTHLMGDEARSLAGEKIVAALNEASALRAEVEGYRTEPMIYEVVFTKGKHQGTTTKTIAFNDKSVEDAVGDTGYINGIGSLYGNGFTYLPIKPNAGEEGTDGK